MCLLQNGIFFIFNLLYSFLENQSFFPDMAVAGKQSLAGCHLNVILKFCQRMKELRIVPLLIDIIFSLVTTMLNFNLFLHLVSFQVPDFGIY